MQISSGGGERGLDLVVVVVEVKIGGCRFNLHSDQWGVAMGLQPWVYGEDRFSAMGLREEEQEKLWRFRGVALSLFFGKNILVCCEI